MKTTGIIRACIAVHERKKRTDTQGQFPHSIVHVLVRLATLHEPHVVAQGPEMSTILEFREVVSCRIAGADWKKNTHQLLATRSIHRSRDNSAEKIGSNFIFGANCDEISRKNKQNKMSYRNGWSGCSCCCRCCRAGAHLLTDS